MKRVYKLIYDHLNRVSYDDPIKAWCSFEEKDKRVFLLGYCYVDHLYRNLGIGTWLIWESLNMMDGFAYGDVRDGNGAMVKILEYFKFEKEMIKNGIFTKYFKNLRNFEKEYPEIDKLKITKPKIVSEHEHLIIDGTEKIIIQGKTGFLSWTTDGLIKGLNQAINEYPDMKTYCVETANKTFNVENSAERYLKLFNK